MRPAVLAVVLGVAQVPSVHAQFPPGFKFPGGMPGGGGGAMPGGNPFGGGMPGGGIPGGMNPMVAMMAQMMAQQGGGNPFFQKPEPPIGYWVRFSAKVASTTAKAGLRRGSDAWAQTLERFKRSVFCRHVLFQ